MPEDLIPTPEQIITNPDNPTFTGKIRFTVPDTDKNLALRAILHSIYIVPPETPIPELQAEKKLTWKAPKQSFQDPIAYDFQTPLGTARWYPPKPSEGITEGYVELDIPGLKDTDYTQAIQRVLEANNINAKLLADSVSLRITNPESQKALLGNRGDLISTQLEINARREALAHIMNEVDNASRPTVRDADEGRTPPNLLLDLYTIVANNLDSPSDAVQDTHSLSLLKQLFLHYQSDYCTRNNLDIQSMTQERLFSLLDTMDRNTANIILRSTIHTRISHAITYSDNNLQSLVHVVTSHFYGNDPNNQDSAFDVTAQTTFEGLPDTQTIASGWIDARYTVTQKAKVAKDGTVTLEAQPRHHLSCDTTPTSRTKKTFWDGTPVGPNGILEHLNKLGVQTRDTRPVKTSFPNNPTKVDLTFKIS